MNLKGRLFTVKQQCIRPKCFSKSPHIRSHRAPRLCFPKKVSIQLMSEQLCEVYRNRDYFDIKATCQLLCAVHYSDILR